MVRIEKSEEWKCVFATIDANCKEEENRMHMLLKSANKSGHRSIGIYIFRTNILSKCNRRKCYLCNYKYATQTISCISCVKFMRSDAMHANMRSAHKKAKYYKQCECVRFFLFFFDFLIMHTCSNHQLICWTAFLLLNNSCVTIRFSFAARISNCLRNVCS